MTLLIMTLISLSILFFPLANPIEYAIDYNKDDLVVQINADEINSALPLMQNQIKTILNNTGYVHQYSMFYITSFFITYDNSPIQAEEGLAKVIFDSNQPQLKLPEVWYREHFVNELQTEELLFPNITVSLQHDLDLDNRFNAILTLPPSYQQNFSKFYIGVELNRDYYRGIDVEILRERLSEDIEGLEQAFQTVDSVLRVEKPVDEALGPLEEGFSTILLQNVLILLLIIGSLVIILYYLQSWTYREELQNYLILQYRGISREEQMYTVPILFILFQVLLNTVVTVSLIYGFKTTINVVSFLPPIVALGTASLAAYTNVTTLLELEPPDATEIKLDPSYLEQTMLVLTIIAALFNLYLNFPIVQNIEVILVLVIYVSVGLLFAVMIHFGVVRARRLIITWLGKQDHLSDPIVAGLYLQKMMLRKSKQHLRLLLLVGFVLLFATSHIYITYQADQSLQQTNRPEVWGIYDNYQDVDQLGGEVREKMDLLIPAEIDKLGISLSGIILTPDDIPSHHPELVKLERKNNLPAIWFDSSLRDSFQYQVLTSDDIPILLQYGEFDEELANAPVSTFASDILLPFDPQFIVVVPPVYLKDYNSSSAIIFRPTGEEYYTELQLIEQSLLNEIAWLERPRDGPVQVTIRTTSESFTIANPLIVIGVLNLSLLGFGITLPILLFQSDQQKLRVLGIRSESLLKGAGIERLFLLPIFLIGVILGSILVVLLIQLFNLLPAIYLSLNLIQIVSFSIITIISFYVGEIMGWIMVMRTGEYEV